jgi:plastocyanin
VYGKRKGGNMNKAIVILLIVLVLGGGAYLFIKSNSRPATEPTQTADQVTTTPVATTGSSSNEIGTPAAAKEFTVSGNEFAFSPKTLAVSKGDTVNVTFTNTGTFPHNFTIKELNVQGKTIQPGESDTVTFTADKAGSFQYICSVPGHADKGMTGTLIVK